MNEDEYCGDYIPADAVAARTQSYMWLVETLAEVKDNPELVKECMAMLETVRATIKVPVPKAKLSEIRGGKTSE